MSRLYDGDDYRQEPKEEIWKNKRKMIYGFFLYNIGTWNRK